METSLSEAENLALAADWESICRRMVKTIKRELKTVPRYEDRDVAIAVGASGDVTRAIDALAETAVFDELEKLANGGADFYALSEERGVVDFGSRAVKVLIDPVDGSLNAKRVGQSWSLALAVSVGETMADVEFAFVYDFGANEEWTARRGRGAFLDGVPIEPELAGNDLELVALESTMPKFLTAELMAALEPRVKRIRSIGSISLTLCQVAAARYDGMLTLRYCRPVDAAAAQLIAREAGVHIQLGDDADLRAPLDLAPYKFLAAARDSERTAFLLSALA